MFKIGIVGATGFTGEELLKIFQKHKAASVEFVTSERRTGTRLEEVFPGLISMRHLQLISAEEAQQEQVDLVFLCLPAGESALPAQMYYSSGIPVIDLGADFRFAQKADYKNWYHMDHKTPELLDKAVYGLPEWYRNSIRDARIIGNPGCYPTSVLLPLLPLFEQELIADPVIVDAKSGVSGAGRSLKTNTQFCAANENVSPYNAGRVHRHVGEMEQYASQTRGKPVMISFTPHLVPLTRGMLSTIYCTLNPDTTDRMVRDALQNRYAREAFVHVIDDWPHLQMAQHTNHCFISWKRVEGTSLLLLASVIDNLGKGAASQAVQNMNLMLGIDETEGLL